MMPITQLSDDQLREQLIEQYMQHVCAYPVPEAIQAMTSELYRRGYQRADVIKLALVSLLRQQNQLN